jgi:uncharacterized protein (DUF58 family)
LSERLRRLVPRGSLTSRGRALVAAGTTSAACGLLFGMDDLIRVGVLLVVLPLVAAAATSRGREHRLGLSRLVSPRRVPAGHSSLVRLTLTNDGSGATGLLLLEEEVPADLGARPQFVVDRMGQGRRRTVEYTVNADRRGRFQLGPVAVGLTDPFGLVRLRRTFSSTTSLVVTPRVVDLPAIPVGGGWTGTGDNRPRAFAGGSAEDVTVRDYRLGDELRRIHWRATAHAGQLMVRREEQPWQSRATLLLDNRAPTHAGAGAASSLEYAVSAAASIATHLVSRGFRVRLVTAIGGGGDLGWHEAGTHADVGPLLEQLAVLSAVPRTSFDLEWAGEERQSGLIVAVLGATTAADGPALARARRSGATAFAVAVNVREWASPGEAAHFRRGPDLPMLAHLGWQVALAGRNDPLSAVWEQLGPRRAPANVLIEAPAEVS